MASIVDIVQTPTITSGVAYASGQALGGLLTFASATRFQEAYLRQVIINDTSNQKSHISLILFNQTFTATADKSALAISSADSLNCIGSIDIPAASYVNIASGIASVTVNMQSFAMFAQGGQNSIFGQLLCLGTPTYASTTAIQVRCVFDRYMTGMGP